ncbi:MAG: UbiD family decarboxylase [Pirellulaceae bacterium]
MIHRTLAQCIADLERAGQLVRCSEEVSATLEAAEIQRRVYRSAGPAVLFEKIAGCRFPMVSNLFGTLERAHFIFRHTFEHVRQLIALKSDPGELARTPLKSLRALPTVWHMRPVRRSRGAVLAHELTVDQLPQLKSWPDDGGAFITLPQVYTEDVRQPGLSRANLGMYRVQLSGGLYVPNQQVGLHYQLHRGIGGHHAAALEQGKPLRVNIFVGGTPAMTLAAVMPLPEGVSELTFAGALAGHRIPLVSRPGQLPVYAEADFCIQGSIDPVRLLPEGPFGDHLGYYSREHKFPFMRVERVTCREGALWPFTVVGRPPQEDTVFGQLIHELTAPLIPSVVPGVQAVHAVDAAGVHPLMLAIGSERYVPYESIRFPRELLTQANAILGQGQMSLAKYLWIVDRSDDPDLDIHDVGAFLQHALLRVDWRRDLHFQTCTTIDTLDYCGTAMNEGSKVTIAAAGPPIRTLPTQVPGDLQLPAGFSAPRVCQPGVLALQGPRFEIENEAVTRFCRESTLQAPINQFPWIVVVDDSEFTARNLENFLWVTFTRSDPASDIDGVAAFVDRKHWGCRGALVTDARIKPKHAPPLVEDPEVTAHVDAMAARGGTLARYL